MTTSNPALIPRPPRLAIVGAGPAGLMAAEAAAAGGAQVEVFDASATAARKFLLAGKGGLNLTHSEPLDGFVARYGPAQATVAPWLAELSPEGLRAWAHGLGIPTFVGSSGKVFPEGMKAAPLLRAWLARLRAAGVRFHQRHRWAGPLPSGAPLSLNLHGPQGPRTHVCDAVILALGGASWPHLGADGAWVAPLQEAKVPLSPLAPANCGLELAWSPLVASSCAGHPLKNVRIVVQDGNTVLFDQIGECVLTSTGLEGNLVYAASRAIRQLLQRDGQACLTLDLLPRRSLAELTQALAAGRGARSLANHLKEQAGLSGTPAKLLREGMAPAAFQEAARDARWLAGRIKALPLQVSGLRPLAEAISTAGGVRLDALTPGLMLQGHPGIFCAGEMLDWDAPTGGYLLTACMASGRVAGQAALAWAAQHATPAAAT